ncbi:unnamed protein product [Peniophora sp. CBMAI 1063]|nr:unnamed protein product [Peniophora sp. CBMAI 1063]
MPDWKSPSELTRDSLLLVKLLHACLGWAIWEYVSHFHYEWDVYRGNRRYRWTIWVYTSCRLAMLSTFTFHAIAINGGTWRHCTTLFMAGMASAYVAISLASLLIVLRITAVWEKKPVVVTVSYIAWLTCLALNVYNVTTLRAAYDGSSRGCLPYDTKSFVFNSIGILASDTVLLVLMLAGILRVRRNAVKNGISRVLYRQGVVWLIVAILVEVPAVAFALLELNDPLTVMFQPVELVSLVICAGHMYRGLLEYVYKPDTNLSLGNGNSTHLLVRSANTAMSSNPVSGPGSSTQSSAGPPGGDVMGTKGSNAAPGYTMQVL